MNEGIEQVKKRNWGKIGCFGVLGLFAFLGILVAIAPEPTPEQIAERKAAELADEAKEAEERQAEAQSKIDQATAVSSRELAAAYDANEVRAQQNFGDRSLLVTGRVTGITLDFSDDPVVQLEGVNQFLPVQADLNDKAVASQLDKGQQIKILCNKITEVISAPMLSDCEIIPE